MHTHRNRLDALPFEHKREEGLSDIWLGSMRGTRRFILTGILASAGLFLVAWIGFLWLMIWLFPAML